MPLPNGASFIQAYLDPEGILRANPGTNLPYAMPILWLRCFEAYLKDPNHSAVYGEHLGFVGGEDPYFYDPTHDPEIQQRPPEGVSMVEYIAKAHKILSGLERNAIYKQES